MIASLHRRSHDTARHPPTPKLTLQPSPRFYTSRQNTSIAQSNSRQCSDIPNPADRRCPYPAISHLDNNRGQCRPRCSLCSRLCVVARYSGAYCKGWFVIGRRAPIYQYRAWSESVPKRPHYSFTGIDRHFGCDREREMGFRHLAEWHAVPCGEGWQDVVMVCGSLRFFVGLFAVDGGS